MTIPAVPEQVREARAFVAWVLGESHLEADVVLLLASELVTNSVRHSGSAVTGGVVTVTVTAREKMVRAEATGAPHTRPVPAPGACGSGQG